MLTTKIYQKTFMKWNIGCSGFAYKEWKGVFYPDKMAADKWFNFYASQFNTVELYNTFYRFPSVEKLLGWYEESPDNFSFSVKVPKLITHFKQLVDADLLINFFYVTSKDGLREKLGEILFQFPSKFDYSEARLQQLIKSLDTSFTNVVEFRHSSCWNEEVYTQPARNKIIFCGTSHPSLPDDIIVVGPVICHCFHGAPSLYYFNYKEDVLKAFADDIGDVQPIRKVNCYFNNTASTNAIKNARFLLQYCD